MADIFIFFILYHGRGKLLQVPVVILGCTVLACSLYELKTLSSVGCERVIIQFRNEPPSILRS